MNTADRYRLATLLVLAAIILMLSLCGCGGDGIKPTCELPEGELWVVKAQGETWYASEIQTSGDCVWYLDVCDNHAKYICDNDLNVHPR